MQTLHYRLTTTPDVDDFADRDYRRQVAVLVEDQSATELDGLRRVLVTRSDVLGDPIELAFELRQRRGCKAAKSLPGKDRDHRPLAPQHDAPAPLGGFPPGRRVHRERNGRGALARSVRQGPPAGQPRYAGPAVPRGRPAHEQ